MYAALQCLGTGLPHIRIFSPHSFPVLPSMLLSAFLGKLGHRGDKQPVHGLTADKQRSQDSNLRLRTPSVVPCCPAIQFPSTFLALAVPASVCPRRRLSGYN